MFFEESFFRRFFSKFPKFFYLQKICQNVFEIFSKKISHKKIFFFQKKEKCFVFKKTKCLCITISETSCSAEKKKTFNFSFCKSFVDFVATILEMMFCFLRARHCKYFGTKDFSNKKIKRNKQREKQEFCTKPKNSETAKTM